MKLGAKFAIVDIHADIMWTLRTESAVVMKILKSLTKIKNNIKNIFWGVLPPV